MRIVLIGRFLGRTGHAVENIGSLPGVIRPDRADSDIFQKLPVVKPLVILFRSIRIADLPPIERNPDIVVVRGVHRSACPILFQDAQTRNLVGFFTSAVQSRKKNRGQDRDDRNYNEEFYKSESGSFILR